MAQSEETKEIKKAIRQYKKAVKALQTINGSLIGSIIVGGTIEDLEADIHELNQELDESKENDKEN